MKKGMLFISIGIFLVLSCNKTPMKDGLEVFVGIWVWDRTYIPADDGTGEVDTLLAANDLHIYKIKITSKGKMFWYKDDNEIKEINIKLTYNDCGNGACGCFATFEENNDVEEMKYSSCGEGEIEKLLLLSEFPMGVGPSEGSNIFIRE